MMHDIEKQVIVECIAHEQWMLYCATVEYGIAIADKSITAPAIVCICAGINSAGIYYKRHAKYNGKPTIEINTAYYNGGSVVSLTETIAHELAHHIVGALYPMAKQAHGIEFRQVMHSIGASGSTYHAMNTKLARQVARKAKDELFDF